MNSSIRVGGNVGGNAPPLPSPPPLPLSLPLSLPRQPPDLSRRLKLGMQQFISCGRKTSENFGKLRKTSKIRRRAFPVPLRGAVRRCEARGHKSKGHRAATAGPSCRHPSPPLIDVQHHSKQGYSHPPAPDRHRR